MPSSESISQQQNNLKKTIYEIFITGKKEKKKKKTYFKTNRLLPETKRQNRTSKKKDPPQNNQIFFKTWGAQRFIRTEKQRARKCSQFIAQTAEPRQLRSNQATKIKGKWRKRFGKTRDFGRGRDETTRNAELRVAKEMISDGAHH